MAPSPGRRGWSPTPNTPDVTPWYRQFWPWLLVLLPFTAVVGGVTTLVISMQDPDGLVVDDYYKAGLAINRTLERRDLAARLGIAAEGRVEIATGDLYLDLRGEGLRTEGLQLRLSHATRSEHDQLVPLKAIAPGRVAGQLQGPLRRGAWGLSLEPIDGVWRITGRAFVGDGDSPVALSLAP